MHTVRLAGKNAVVTGASSGIGLAIAEQFAREGARVVLVARDNHKVQQAASEIGGEAEGYSVDVSVEESVKTFSQMLAKKLDRLDILVNNAGIFFAGNVENTSFEKWNSVLSTNLNSAFLCTKYLLPLMTEKGGSIINIASEAGIVGIAGQPAYNVSKAGLISLTKSCAVDYAGKNIRVNCICPGRVHTPLVEKVIKDSENPQETKYNLENDRPMGRIGRVEEIAAAAMLFAADDCLYATGSILQVDGGYTALPIKPGAR